MNQHLIRGEQGILLAGGMGVRSIELIHFFIGNIPDVHSRPASDVKMIEGGSICS